MSQIKYDKNGKITNIKCCPLCGELREVSTKFPYYCDKLGMEFTHKDLVTPQEFAGWYQNLEGFGLIDAIEFRREHYGWSKKQMAEALGLQRSHYSEFVNGERNLPFKARQQAYLIGIPSNILIQLDD